MGLSKFYFVVEENIPELIKTCNQFYSNGVTFEIISILPTLSQEGLPQFTAVVAMDENVEQIYLENVQHIALAA